MGQLRIIAGSLKNRRLKVPGGRELRPTGERVREALFSILAPRLPGARVADLYAGTGALGWEALSRGAAFSCFVESRAAHCRLIEENGQALGLAGRYQVFCRRLPQALQIMPPAFDLVFLDPPYADVTGLTATLQELARTPVLAATGLAVAECDRRRTPPPVAGLFLVDNRNYGDTVLFFYSQKERR